MTENEYLLEPMIYEGFTGLTAVFVIAVKFSRDYFLNSTTFPEVNYTHGLQ